MENSLLYDLVESKLYEYRKELGDDVNDDLHKQFVKSYEEL